jgi:hypothetical protein
MLNIKLNLPAEYQTPRLNAITSSPFNFETLVKSTSAMWDDMKKHKAAPKAKTVKFSPPKEELSLRKEVEELKAELSRHKAKLGKQVEHPKHCGIHKDFFLSTNGVC